MTGILVECCNERMLSDSIMEKKEGISGGLSTEQAVLHRQTKEKDTHMQYKPHFSYNIFNERVLLMANHINPALSN